MCEKLMHCDKIQEENKLASERKRKKKKVLDVSLTSFQYADERNSTRSCFFLVRRTLLYEFQVVIFQLELVDNLQHFLNGLTFASAGDAMTKN